MRLFAWQHLLRAVLIYQSKFFRFFPLLFFTISKYMQKKGTYAKEKIKPETFPGCQKKMVLLNLQISIFLAFICKPKKNKTWKKTKKKTCCDKHGPCISRHVWSHAPFPHVCTDVSMHVFFFRLCSTCLQLRPPFPSTIRCGLAGWRREVSLRRATGKL